MDNDLLYSRVAAQFFGRPLLLRQHEAEIIGNFLRARMAGERPAPDASRFAGEDQIDPATQRWRGFRRQGAVGIVSIMGELVNRGAWLGARSGLTSYEGIAQQIRNAAGESEVSRIVLDIQSPGGEAIGMAETGRLIRSISASKPVTAVINGMAASAAYGLASGASEIVITESAIAGSIGVVLVHQDQSRRLEEMGVKTTLIHAGAQKIVGNSFGPLSRDDVAILQAEVNKIMDGFVRLVADHRGMDAQAVRDQEAAIFIGEDAIAAGLADRIGTFDDVLSDLSRAQGGRVNANQGRFTMSGKNESAPAAEPAGISQEDHDQAIAAARDEGHAAGIAEGRQAGAADAYARISAVVATEGIAGSAPRLAAALKLALKSVDMPAEDVSAFAIENVPESAKPAALADRESEPDSLAHMPQPKADADPWGDVVEKVNKRRGYAH